MVIKATDTLRLSQNEDEYVTKFREARLDTCNWGTRRYMAKWLVGGEYDPGSINAIKIRNAIRQGYNTKNSILNYLQSQLSYIEIQRHVRNMNKMGIIIKVE